MSLPTNRMEPHPLPAGRYLLAASRWSVTGLQTYEKLVFAATDLDAPDKSLGADQAERLANACAQSGIDWIDGPHEVDLDHAVQMVDELLFGQIEDDFDRFVEDVSSQNEDRADLQIRNLDRHLINQQNKMIRVRDRHEVMGRGSLVKATEGRIQALENRVERQKVKVENGRGVRPRSDELFIALVCVTP